MKKTAVISLLIGALVFSGCATNIRYRGQDFSQVRPLVVAVSNTPRKAEYFPLWRFLGDISAYVLVTGAAGIFVGCATFIPLSYIPLPAVGLPADYDYTGNLARAFLEQAQQELPGWPGTYVMAETNDVASLHHAYHLNFDTKYIYFSYTLKCYTYMLGTRTDVTLQDAQSNVVWRKVAKYIPANIYEHDHSMHALKENGRELMVDELQHSVLVTASNLVEDLACRTD